MHFIKTTNVQTGCQADQPKSLNIYASGQNIKNYITKAFRVNPVIFHIISPQGV